VNAPLKEITAVSPAKEGRPLRVLHLLDSLGVGGAETWLLELLRHWRDNGAVHVDIVATGGERGVFDDEARTLGAQVFYLRYGRRHLPSFVSAFRKVLREGRYDALHDHQDYASGWHYLMGRGLLPAVRATHVHNPAYQIRNNYGVTLGRRLTARAGKRLVARYATHILGTSRGAITAYGFDDPAFAATPRAALHCGIDPSRFLASAQARASIREEFGWRASDAVALFAGRFDVSPDPTHPQTHKNSGFAVDVAIECARRCDAIRFVFVGPPSAATAALVLRVSQAGLEDRIVFAGVRLDVGRLMGGADALLFPSRAEGLGMVAVEAQAAGLPVLASTGVPRECAVVPQLVRFLDLDHGVDAWANQLLAAIDAPRLDPADANRQVAGSAFSIQHSASALERLYRDGVLA
jgi:glycosyltransferase involved in cell wall biosynthesis